MNNLRIKQYSLVFFFFIQFFNNSIAQEKKVDPKLTEVWDPVPKLVSVNEKGVPSDAIILWDGSTTEEFIHQKDGAPLKWDIDGDILSVKEKTGSIKTVRKFGDCQLHVEFRFPERTKAPNPNPQLDWNSGIFLQSKYEVQILNYSEDNKTYSNGQCGAIYKQSIPLVNAIKTVNEWQVYDIIFKAPQWEGKKLIKPASVTVLHNGVLIQDHFELKGSTTWRGQPVYKRHGKEPLFIQEHKGGDGLSFKNIWIREL